jgi:hypothetical protein
MSDVVSAWEPGSLFVLSRFVWTRLTEQMEGGAIAGISSFHASSPHLGKYYDKASGNGDLIMKIKHWLTFVTMLLFCGLFSEAQTRFSLLFNEGFGSARIGDVNTTLVSTNAAYDVLRKNVPGAVAGEYLPMPTRFRDWQAELIWNVWRGLRIGIAVSGPLHFSGTSVLTHTWFGYQSGFPQTMNNTLASDIHVSAPIRLNLGYTIPIMSRVNLVVQGGIGYYRAQIDRTWSFVFRNPDESSDIGEHYLNVTGKQIGYHGGIALEYAFAKSVSLILAGDWRLAKIESFEGSELHHIDIFDGYGVLQESSDLTSNGFLYHLIGDADYIWDVRHEKLILSSSFPDYGYDNPFGQRKAFLDLGGFTFRIGVKIGLF